MFILIQEITNLYKIIKFYNWSENRILSNLKQIFKTKQKKTEGMLIIYSPLVGGGGDGAMFLGLSSIE